MSKSNAQDGNKVLHDSISLFTPDPRVSRVGRARNSFCRLSVCSINVSPYLSICMYVCPFVPLHVSPYPSICHCLSVCPSVFLSPPARLSVSVRPSVCPRFLRPCPSVSPHLSISPRLSVISICPPAGISSSIRRLHLSIHMNQSVSQAGPPAVRHLACLTRLAACPWVRKLVPDLPECERSEDLT